jgi:rod shape-determining protein MreC
MESVLGRYKNLIVLVAILFAQVLGLAVQVKRTTDTESSRLIRVWAVSAVTPFEKVLVWIQTGTGNLWHNYFYLRGVRAENRELKQQIEQLRLEQIRLNEDAAQARRLQALLGFKEQFISETMPAQVIGSGGSEQSRIVYIDKGEHHGLKPDMAVITGSGVVGKVLKVFRSTSQVLLIDDQSSGVGGILEKSRLQGIVRGTPAGEVVLEKIMNDEAVQPGDIVRTSGGDHIFPKGLEVGVVTRVSNGTGSDLFLNIRVKPAANLSKLEEVLVVTRIEEKEATPAETGPVRAADILSQRLPSVPDKPAPAPSAVPSDGTKSTQATPAPKAPDKNSVPGVPQPNAMKTGEGAAAPLVRTRTAVPLKPSVPGTTTPNPDAAPAGLKSATEHKPAPSPINVTEPSPAAPKPKPTAPPVVPQPAKPQDGQQ